MMARRRMLDPTLWDDPDLAQLTPVERLLFIGLVSLADDYGHVSGNAPLLRKLIFGYDDFTVAQVLEMRNHIVAACRNVELYKVCGQDYLWLKTWERHQDLRFRAKGQCPCHACGRYHTAQDYQACEGAEVGAGLSTTDNGEPLRSSCVDLAQPLRPEELSRVTLSNDTSSNSNAAPNGAAQKPTVKSAPPKQDAKQLPPREDQILFAVLRQQLRYGPSNDSERQKWNKAIKELRAADPPVAPQEIAGLHAAFNQRFQGATCTPMALASNVGLLRSPPPAQSIPSGQSRGRKVIEDAPATQEFRASEHRN